MSSNQEDCNKTRLQNYNPVVSHPGCPSNNDSTVGSASEAIAPTDAFDVK